MQCALQAPWPQKANPNTSSSSCRGPGSDAPTSVLPCPVRSSQKSTLFSLRYVVSGGQLTVSSRTILSSPGPRGSSERGRQQIGQENAFSEGLERRQVLRHLVWVQDRLGASVAVHPQSVLVDAQLQQA